MDKNRYLQFGKYTHDCPQWLLDKVKNIDDSKIDKAYIEKILWVIRDEFDSKKHNTTCTNDFRQSRFISVTDILEKRQTSCGSLSTVIASVLRNLKIPTKLVDGLYIKSNPNMRHAWNEVYLNNKWVPFDITKKGFDIGKYHIRKDEWIDWEDLGKIYKPQQ